MTIVYCLQALHRRGGIERVVSMKANYWASQGHSVHIVTTDQRNAEPAFELAPSVQLHDLGLNYELDNDLGRWGRLKALYLKRPKHKQLLEELLHRIKPDITVSTFFQEAALLPSIQDGSKKVLELHSSRYTKILMYPKNKWLNRVIGRLRIYLGDRTSRKYDRFVILTEEEKEQFPYHNNVSVIPNPRTFAPNTQSDVKTKKILAVGRFEYQKNFSELLTIWSYISRDFPEWTLEIVGDGSFREMLMRQVDVLGIKTQTQISPSTDAIIEHYISSSIYAMTSHFEGLPMVLLEAQAVGLPIVSYACPSGPRDIITDGLDGLDGFLVPTYDLVTFAERLRELMQNNDLRANMSIKALEASERFSQERIMQQWEELFHSLL